MKFTTKLKLLIILLILFFIFYPRDFSEKSIYITVDAEGNDSQIEDISKILEKNEISATFFVVGETAENYPELFKDLNEENSIQCHTYSHVNLRKLNYDEQKEQILKGKEAVEKAIEGECIYFRAPFLKYNWDTKKIISEGNFSSFKDLSLINSIFYSDYLIYKLRISPKLYWKFLYRLTSFRKETMLIIHPQITGEKQENLKYFEEYISKCKDEGAEFKILK